MSKTSLVAAAAASFSEVVREIEPAQLDAPTPCAEYDVRDLLNHLLFWGPSLEGAARKQSVPPPGDSEQAAGLTEGDWAGSLCAQADGMAVAWADPAAWSGTASMGSPTELPASMIGDMTLCELVVHGWDLARATGQDPRYPADVVDTTHEALAGMAEQGRQMGVFGPVVSVSADAPALDRLAALTGRDPAWRPSAGRGRVSCGPPGGR